MSQEKPLISKISLTALAAELWPPPVLPESIKSLIKATSFKLINHYEYSILSALFQ